MGIQQIDDVAGYLPFNEGGDLYLGIDTGADNDSLGDLSDFDDADFEEFADSLLATSAGDDEVLFGHSQSPKKSVRFAPIVEGVNMATSAASRFSTIVDDDDLSDFENEEL